MRRSRQLPPLLLQLTLYDQKTRPAQAPLPMEALPPQPPPPPTSPLAPPLSPPLPLPPSSSSLPSQSHGHTPKTADCGRTPPPPSRSVSSSDRRRDVIGLVAAPTTAPTAAPELTGDNCSVNRGGVGGDDSSGGGSDRGGGGVRVGRGGGGGSATTVAAAVDIFSIICGGGGDGGGGGGGDGGGGGGGGGDGGGGGGGIGDAGGGGSSSNRQQQQQQAAGSDSRGSSAIAAAAPYDTALGGAAARAQVDRTGCNIPYRESRSSPRRHQQRVSEGQLHDRLYKLGEELQRQAAQQNRLILQRCACFCLYSWHRVWKPPTTRSPNAVGEDENAKRCGGNDGRLSQTYVKAPVVVLIRTGIAWE